jgi:hypothetical protein
MRKSTLRGARGGLDNIPFTLTRLERLQVRFLWTPETLYYV